MHYLANQSVGLLSSSIQYIDATLDIASFSSLAYILSLMILRDRPSFLVKNGMEDHMEMWEVRLVYLATPKACHSKTVRET
jgi:hypothetical protein